VTTSGGGAVAERPTVASVDVDRLLAIAIMAYDAPTV
jgi:hypothetical protein